jgi:putative MATE family efflux protein
METDKKPLFGPMGFYSAALALVVPIMLQSLIGSMVSLVDNFMVAGLGDVKMAAVNVANQLNFIYFVLLNATAIGGGIFLSQHRGAGDPDGMRQAYRFKLLVSLAFSLVHIAICLFWAEPILRLLLSSNRAAPAIAAEGARYLRVLLVSSVPIAVSTATASAYRDIGKTSVPLVFSSVAALVNTFFNWVFIYGNLGSPRLEVEGAAIATDIARLCEMAAFLAWTAHTRPSFSFKPLRFLALDGRLFRTMLGKSGPIFFSETAWVVSETIITAICNSRGGAETVAGMAAGWTIANLFMLIFGAIQSATGIIVGSTLGAGKLEEAKTKARWILSGALALGAAVGLLATGSVFLIPLVFGNLSAPAQTVTRSLLYVIAVYIPLWAYINAQFAVSRAGGDTIMGLWVDVGVTYALFVPAAFLFAALTPWGPVEIYAVAKLTDFVKLGVAAWWLKRECWVKNLAKKETA